MSKPIQVWKIDYVDYIDVAKRIEVNSSDELDMQAYNYFKEAMKKTAHVEGKTRQGAVSNLKNILYQTHLEIISAVAVC